ncbi:hypothetical protein GQ457_13G018250 [Hibiscus cannabinus]
MCRTGKMSLRQDSDPVTSGIRASFSHCYQIEMPETTVSDSEYVGRRETRQTKAKRASSKDRLTTLEDKVSRLESSTKESRERLDVVEFRLEELDAREDKLKDEVQGLLNETIEHVDQQDSSLKDEVIVLKKMVEELTRNTDERAPKSEMMILKKEIEELKGELRVYKTTVTNGVMSGTPSTPIDIPKPKEFKGTRNAQDVENYIWELEEYFQAANITEDTKKVKIASIYLTDFARMWWRRRCTDEKHGGTKVETWEEFQEELKAHFYPVYAEEEAQSKLRQLKHTGNIRDYVREFTELHLQIPDMTEKQALFTFRDGLKPWAKAELQRRGVTELSKALAAAESLTEFQKSESPKQKAK